MNWAGYVSLVGLVVITFLDVASGYLFNKPIKGSLEIVESTMTVFACFALFYATINRQHIAVDLFFVRFPKRIQNIVDIFGSLLGFAIWGVVGYEVYVVGMRMVDSGETTSFLGIPLYPFEFLCALGLFLYSLVLLLQVIFPSKLKEVDQSEGGLSI